MAIFLKLKNNQSSFDEDDLRFGCLSIVDKKFISRELMREGNTCAGKQILWKERIYFSIEIFGKFDFIFKPFLILFVVM